MAKPARRAWRQREVVALSPRERVGVRGCNAPRITRFAKRKRRSITLARVIVVDSVEIGGGTTAEVFLRERRLVGVFTQVAFPLPAPALASFSLQLPFLLANLAFGGFHGAGVLVHGWVRSGEMAIEPGNKIQSVPRGVGFEFQGMMAVGIFDHLTIPRRQLLKIRERLGIINDPVLPRQHQ